MMRSPQSLPQVFTPGPIDGAVFKPLPQYHDERGWLSELFRLDELPPDLHPAMAYISQTLPGVSRGPHEHAHQTDLFAFLGPGDFTVYLWDIRGDSPTFGRCIRTTCGQSNPQVVIIPPGVVHGYRNDSEYPGLVFNAPNRLYAGEGKREPVDEIRHEDDVDSSFVMD